MSNILDQVDEFMKNSSRNLWLQDDILSIYVRRSLRKFDGELQRCFDVSNIHQINPKYAGQGYFRKFMEKVEQFGYPVYVESISLSNTHLLRILTKNGYTLINKQYGVDENYGICNAIKYPKIA